MRPTRTTSWAECGENSLRRRHATAKADREQKQRSQEKAGENEDVTRMTAAKGAENPRSDALCSDRKASGRPALLCRRAGVRARCQAWNPWTSIRHYGLAPDMQPGCRCAGCGLQTSCLGSSASAVAEGELTNGGARMAVPCAQFSPPLHQLTPSRRATACTSVRRALPCAPTRSQGPQGGQHWRAGGAYTPLKMHNRRPARSSTADYRICLRPAQVYINANLLAINRRQGNCRFLLITASCS